MEVTTWKWLMNVTLTVPDHIYEAAEAVSESENRSIEELLSEVILQAFETFPIDENQSELVREKEAYLSQHTLLWEKFPFENVAVKNAYVIDHDVDITRLFDRVSTNHPGELVLLEQVLPVAERIIHFRSPRFVQN